MENIVQNVQNLSVNDQQPQSESINLQDSDSAVATNNIISSEDTDIINAVAFINSNEAEDQFKGIVCLRKLLSKEQSPPIAKIVDTNICPRAISLAHKCEDSFTFEVTWMLTNILSGSSTDTQYLISLDIISFLLTIFERDNLDIKEQVL